METPHHRDSADESSGYDAVASEFMAIRTGSRIGVATVRGWAETLPPGGAVLDLGCGHGVPIAEALVDAGLDVYGVDASPGMVAAYRARFPGSPVECARVEESRFFGRTFAGVVAWGLLFLLAPEAQVELIRRVARALEPGGRFLFTAPWQATEWADVLTGRRSRSLGSDAYRRILLEAGLTPAGEAVDEGENHYYFADRLQP